MGTERFQESLAGRVTLSTKLVRGHLVENVEAPCCALLTATRTYVSMYMYAQHADRHHHRHKKRPPTQRPPHNDMSSLNAISERFFRRCAKCNMKRSFGKYEAFAVPGYLVEGCRPLRIFHSSCSDKEELEQREKHAHNSRIIFLFLQRGKDQ